MPKYTRTVCLEFFGQGARGDPQHPGDWPVPRTSAKLTGTLLAGLEHLDERYLRAVGYSTSPKRRNCRKWCWLGDIIGEDADAVAAATSHVVRLANARSGEGFIAVNPEARRKFWLGSRQNAAIANIPTPSRSMRMW